MRPELFTTRLSILDFSIRGSPLLGSTTEAENNNVETVSIEFIHQWRKMEADRGTEEGLSMRHVYMQVSISVVAALGFSRSN